MVTFPDSVTMVTRTSLDSSSVTFSDDNPSESVRG